MPLTGLTQQEAASRLERDGPNELPEKSARHPFALFLEVLKQPMFLLLLGAGGVYLLLGEAKEAIPLGVAVLIIVFIEYVQEHRTERALAALRKMGSPTAHVIRDGNVQQVRAADVVAGDLVVVSEGERVPADAVIVSTSGLQADESLLTGESVPVEKQLHPRSQDDFNRIFSGTLITSGHAVAEVESTGVRTRIGQIGASLQQIVPEVPLLKIEIDRLVRLFGFLGVSTCLLIVVLYRVTRGNWLEGVLAAVTAAISLIPEEFPVVLTVFLALGAWRIAKHRVLARNTQVIETLGAANVLCVDKTGTITLNQMTIGSLVPANDSADTGLRNLTAQQIELLDIGVLAGKEHGSDPMETAFQRLAREQSGRDYPTRGLRLVKEFPLTSAFLAVVHVWEREDEPGSYVVAAKGAPEAVASLCRMEEPARHQVLGNLERMALDGLRVLAVAKTDIRGARLPGTPHELQFDFLGLVGFEDPVRPGVREAMAECHAAGVRVLMMTGDHRATAAKVAREVGIAAPDDVVTGIQLEEMSPETVSDVVKKHSVFARVKPEHKLIIVQALKQQGAIVAMTGDGVNDAPALKAAHIGVAMGKRGTDVAREASSLVLLDDDFTSIVAAMRAGRRVYDNLRRAVAYIIALHVPLAGLATLPLIFGWPLLVFPLHILFFEFVTDPACAVVFEAEPEARSIMTRPPRPRSERLLNIRIFGVALLQGAAILGGVLWVVQQSLVAGAGENMVRTLAITTLIIANVALILVNRSWTEPLWKALAQRNASFWIMAGSVLLALAAILSFDALLEAFKFSSVTPSQIGWCTLIAIATVIWFEFLKLLAPRWTR